MQFKIIIDRDEGRKTITLNDFSAAIDLARGAALRDGFLSVRVFDPNGHIVAQAYEGEGRVLRP